MHTNSRHILACLSAVLVLAVVDRPGNAQHVHGRIELDIVLDDGALAVSLRAPLADVVGFEHRPENDAQTARLRDAVALLSSANSMFGTPESAACVVQHVSIDGPEFLVSLLDAGRVEAGHGAEPGHEHESGNAGHEHESSNAEHAHEAGHSEQKHEAGHSEHEHESEHAEHDTHSEVAAEYVWACDDPSDVDVLATRFVPGFESVDEIIVQIVSPDGARYLEAGGETETITIGSP